MVPEWIISMNSLGRNKIPFLFILDFDLKNPMVIPLNEINTEEILFQFPEASNTPKQTALRKNIQINPNPLLYNDFLIKFNAVQDEIKAGNTYLLNLTFETPVNISSGLKEVFFCSQAKYKLLLKDRFVFFSPESFVKIHVGKITTFPMKGTLEKRNKNSLRELLNDPKEEAEHATITDLLRNDLGRVAGNIRVKRYRFMDEIRTGGKTILQISSEIEGEILPFYTENLGHLFEELLPAGSVTGAPKKKTVEIIRSVEGYNRGFYTGVCGIFDGKNLDSAVMIRFIENRNGNFYYKSGGGITFMSNPEKEYQEIIQKIYVPVY
ncbi:MAG: aminodeoxychorismate synthase component I [Bacteroidales bacterium]|nr:aminodeoxychorismate synthase component I [Bacteroidales bacterium]